jgi:hypothetical protein
MGLILPNSAAGFVSPDDRESDSAVCDVVAETLSEGQHEDEVRLMDGGDRLGESTDSGEVGALGELEREKLSRVQTGAGQLFCLRWRT